MSNLLRMIRYLLFASQIKDWRFLHVEKTSKFKIIVKRLSCQLLILKYVALLECLLCRVDEVGVQQDTRVRGPLYIPLDKVEQQHLNSQAVSKSRVS
jgi:hypothetical protein